ncbi:hypothetical protein ACQKFK_19600 [Bacillus mycoides]|uniref:hypothetical protein n=1 Tax=Bacillus mycoides TaxID=1405 RepID=UPI003D05EE76
MKKREELKLNIDDILENNYLIADLMMIPEMRKRLENATREDIKKISEYFKDKKKVKEFASLLKSGKYEDYCKSKIGDQDYQLLIDSLKEVAGVGKYEILYKACYKLLCNIGNQDHAIKEFIKTLDDFSWDVLLELMEPLEREKNIDIGKIKKKIKFEVAKKLKEQGVSLDIIKSIGELIDEEINKINEVK